MTNQGSGINGEFTILDLLSVINFVVGLQNLDMNIDQADLESVVREIHEHLKMQDSKIDEILRRLNNDHSGNIHENQ